MYSLVLTINQSHCRSVNLFIPRCLKLLDCTLRCNRRIGQYFLRYLRYLLRLKPYPYRLPRSIAHKVSITMAAPQSTSSSPNSSQNQPETIFQQLEAYPWSSDTEFQSGLQAILGPDPSPDQAKHLTLRARCFYYSRYIAKYPSFRLVGISH